MEQSYTVINKPYHCLRIISTLLYYARVFRCDVAVGNWLRKS